MSCSSSRRTPAQFAPELERLLGVRFGRDRVYRWIRSGRIPAVRIGQEIYIELSPEEIASRLIEPAARGTGQG
jgi:excisionase family DNA binding protein